MLRHFRNKKFLKRVGWFIAILIILSFGLFGTATLFTGFEGTATAGKIFDKPIPMKDFGETYRDIQIQAMLQYGDRFREIRQFLDLKKETWDRLILKHEISNRNIEVSDESVIEAIQENPIFQRNGGFDMSLYENFAKYAGIKPRQFEESMRDTLRIAKLYEVVTTPVQVSNAEVLEQFKTNNEKVQISYARVAAESFKNTVTFIEEEGRNHFDQNVENFIIPPTINLAYFEFVNPNDEIATETPEDEIADESEEDDPAFDEAIKIYHELSENSDFQAIAQKNNLILRETGLIPTNAPPSNLGWTFETFNNALNLDINEYTQPLDTQNGYVIVKMLDQQDRRTPTYEEVRDQVEDIVRHQKALIEAKQQAETYRGAISQKLNASQSFKDIVLSLSLPIEQTPLFTRGQYIPNIGFSKEFENLAFGLTSEKALSDSVLTVSDAAIILHLDQKEAANDDEFEKQKEAIADRILNQKRGEVFQMFLNNLRAKANLKDLTSDEDERAKL